MEFNCGFARDITERKRLEASLPQQQEQVRLLLDSTAEAIFGLDMRGRCTFCNPAGLRMFRHQVQDLLGKNMTLHNPSFLADGTPASFEHCSIVEVLRNGKGTHGENEVFWRADGTSFSGEVWSYPIHQGNAQVGAVVSVLDITERKRAEQELKASEERYRLANAMQDINSALSPDGRITFIGPQVQRYGYSVEELTSQFFEDFIVGEDRARA